MLKRKKMPNQTNDFKLCFLNCRSLSNKLGEIKALIYQTKPHVFCFNETWLNRFEPKFRNYVPYWEHRGGPGGGLGIIVSNEVAHRTFVLNPFPNGYLETQAIEVILSDSQILKILNVYNPNQPVTTEEYEHYIAQLGDKYLIVGDYNAHTPILDTSCRRRNFAGRTLETLISDGAACLVNPPDMYTYISPATGTKSCLDICLASPSIAQIADIERWTDVGSDHLVMKVTIFTSPKKILTTGRRKFIDGDTVAVQKFSEDILPSTLIQPTNLDTLVEDFTERLIKSAEDNVPQTSGKPRYFKSTPWWNKDCGRLVAKRRRDRKKLEKHPIPDNLRTYNESTVAAREICDTSKKKSFQEYVSTLKHDTGIKTVWDKFRAFRGGYTPMIYPIEDNNQLVTDGDIKANMLADHFSGISTTQPKIVQDGMDEIIKAAEDSGHDADYNREIQMDELEQSLSRPRKTSAGADNIPYFLLRALSGDTKDELLNIFNQSFITGQLPTSWKIGTVIPILKPGKDPTKTQSYRPITLLSCISKVLERIIQNRLEYIIVKNKYLKPEQCGFVRGGGTMDPLTRIDHELRKHIEMKQLSLVLYVDLKSAFDKVWSKGLIFKLARHGLKGNMLKWFKNYMSDRKMQVKLEGHFSPQKNLEAGTPQGAVCSPTLFNIMLSDLPDDMHIKKYIFADDITIVCSGRVLSVVKDRLQTYINKLVECVENWGLEINASKTFLQLFTRKRIVPPELYMKGHLIEHKKEQRLLGLILDAPLLTWRAHIDYLKSNCIKRINIMKSVASTKWGASAKIIKLFYTSYVRSKIDYGSTLYASAAASQLQKLDPVQNSALRMILGVMRSTPVLSLQAESGMPPLALHRLFLILKDYLRIMYRPEGDETVAQLNLNDGLQNCQLIPKKSFLSSVQYALTELNVTINRNPTHTLSQIPPWLSLSKFVISSQEEESRNPEKFRMYIRTTYEGYKTVFTDGSRTTEPLLSVASAYYVPHTKQVVCWKLAPEHSTIFSELFALCEALKFIESENGVENWIVFTDSLSSLILIKGCSVTYLGIVTKIRRLLITLNSTQQVILHWVKAHVGIPENEVADKAANQGHLNNLITEVSLTREEQTSLLVIQLSKYWDTYWKSNTERTGKGIFLTRIRDNISQQIPYSLPSRRAESAIYRLRVGHAGLKQHLHKIRVSDSDECEECQVPETVEHFLLHCHRYIQHRYLMSARLRRIDNNIIGLSLKLLLGGSTTYYNRRIQILKILIKYLEDTKQIGNL